MRIGSHFRAFSVAAPETGALHPTSAAFKFKNVPSPSSTDLATKARFAIVDGVRYANGGDLDKLHDGKLPSGEDQPSENFFFDAGTAGGRLLIDFGSAVAISQVNTY